MSARLRKLILICFALLLPVIFLPILSATISISRQQHHQQQRASSHGRSISPIDKSEVDIMISNRHQVSKAVKSKIPTGQENALNFIAYDESVPTLDRNRSNLDGKSGTTAFNLGSPPKNHKMNESEIENLSLSQGLGSISKRASLSNEIQSRRQPTIETKHIGAIIRPSERRGRDSGNFSHANLSEAASYVHEEWISYPDETDASESNARRLRASDESTPSITRQQEHQDGRETHNSETSNEDEQEQKPERLKVKQESKQERPMVSKSSTTTTTINDGTKKAKLVTKSSSLPPGLRQRIIQEFIKKGGNPQNIVISDSTITTTSQSKKKTITTVYKVVPTKGRRGGLGVKKRPGQILIPMMRPAKMLTNPVGKQIQVPGEIEDLDQRLPIIGNQKRLKKSRSSGGYAQQGIKQPRPEKMDDLTGDLLEGLNGSSDIKGGPITMGMVGGQLVALEPQVPNQRISDAQVVGKELNSNLEGVPPSEDELDEKVPQAEIPSKNSVMKGVGGGGISLNTLMDAIKQVQQRQQQVEALSEQLEGKERLVGGLEGGYNTDSELEKIKGSNRQTSSQLQQQLLDGKHLTNFKDFGERKDRKTANKQLVPVIIEQPNNEDIEDATGRLSTLKPNLPLEQEQQQQQQPIQQQPLFGEEDLSIKLELPDDDSAKGKRVQVSASVSAGFSKEKTVEQRLNELKKAVVASTERLRERRVKAAAGNGLPRIGNDATKLEEARVSSMTGNELNKNSTSTTEAPIVRPDMPEHAGKRAQNTTRDVLEAAEPVGSSKSRKTHNIMMLIDFNPTTGSSASTTTSTTKAPNKLITKQSEPQIRNPQPLNLGFLPMDDGAGWLDQEFNWRPIRDDDGIRDGRFSEDLRPTMSVSVSDGNHRIEPQLPSGHIPLVDFRSIEPIASLDDARVQQQIQLQLHQQQQQQNMQQQQQQQQVLQQQQQQQNMLQQQQQILQQQQQQQMLQQQKQNQQQQMLLAATAAAVASTPSLPGTTTTALLFGAQTGSPAHYVTYKAPYIHQVNQPTNFAPMFGPTDGQLSYGPDAPVLPEESARTNQLVNQVIDELVMSASGELGQLVSLANATQKFYSGQIGDSYAGFFARNRRTGFV